MNELKQMLIIFSQRYRIALCKSASHSKITDSFARKLFYYELIFIIRD